MRIRRRANQDVYISLESGGGVYVEAQFNLMRLTANDRQLLSTIADAYQRRKSATSAGAVDPVEGLVASGPRA